ncbi:MAG: ankyrin repeat domain-containing protein [Gammaproteobacteria bacterium]
MTALHIAAMEGRTGVAALLLQCGANADAKVKGDHSSVGNHKGRAEPWDTPFHVAARSGSTGVVVVLLAGVNIDRTTRGHQTALHLSARGGHEAIVRLLVAADADVHIRSDTGLTAHGIANIEARNSRFRSLRDGDGDNNGSQSAEKARYERIAELTQATMNKYLYQFACFFGSAHYFDRYAKCIELEANSSSSFGL